MSQPSEGWVFRELERAGVHLMTYPAEDDYGYYVRMTGTHIVLTYHRRPTDTEEPEDQVERLAVHMARLCRDARKRNGQ